MEAHHDRRLWKKRYESGASMRDLPKEITHGDLKLYLKLYKKKN